MTHQSNVQEGRIRTLSISLVVIVAIIASLAVTRYRQESRRADSQVEPEDNPAVVDLDELRSAGF